MANTFTISIHPLRGEWDPNMRRVGLIEPISIHPLRGEWDSLSFPYSSASFYFNPPTPWGVGLTAMLFGAEKIVFQSTHSVGSGTRTVCYHGERCYISIHPLRGEWDETRR